LRQAISLAPQTRLFEPMPLLCEPHRCSPIRGDVVLYYDDNHLTAAGSRQLLPALLPILDWSLAGPRQNRVGRN
jgi:hypothetical protein